MLRELGLSCVRAFWPYVERRAAAGYYEIEQNLDGHPVASLDLLRLEGYGMIELFCSSSEVMRVGLPCTFLSLCWGWNDRLCFSRKASVHAGFACFPTYRDMLEQCEIVQMPGGIHGTDCLFASTSVSSADLTTRITQAGISAGFGIDCLGAVQQGGYALLKKRGGGS